MVAIHRASDGGWHPLPVPELSREEWRELAALWPSLEGRPEGKDPFPELEVYYGSGQTMSVVCPTTQQERKMVTHTQSYQQSQTTSEGTLETVVVYVTRDYSIFRLSKLNRIVDSDRVQKMYDTMKKKNLLRRFPIVVSSGMEIIDGQARFLAAKELGVPVYYQIAPEMSIEDAPDVNEPSKHWGSQDYLHHWAARGNPHYMILRQFLEKYPWVRHSVALAHFFGSSNERNSQIFRLGHYRSEHLGDLDRVVKMAMDFKPYVKFWKDTRFIMALNTLHNFPAYDHKRMLNKMDQIGTRLIRCATIDEYMAVFNAIYNYRTQTQNLVDLTKYRSESARRGAATTKARRQKVE